jgi:hypothetical protein
MTAKIKPVIAWTIANTKGRTPWLVPSFCCILKKDAIQKLVDMYDPKIPWKKLRKDGFKVIKVRIEALE